MIANLTEAKRLGRNTPHQKYHHADGSEVVGASTPAKLGFDTGNLMGWAAKQGPRYHGMLKHAGIVGTIAHFLIQCHLEGDTADLSEFTRAEIDEANIPYVKFRSWWESQDLTIVGTEVQLVSENHRYGGTVDVIARDATGKLVLVDWKSSSGIYADHCCQLSAYRNLVDENYMEQVSRSVIVRGGKQDDETDFDLKWMDEESDPPISRYFEHFKIQLALYNSRKLLK